MKRHLTICAVLAMLLLAAMPAVAQNTGVVVSANASVTCTTFSLSVNMTGLTPGGSYTFLYTLLPSGGNAPTNGTFNFIPSASTDTETINGSFSPPLVGSGITFNLISEVQLLNNFGTVVDERIFTFNPTMITCTVPPPPPCTTTTTNSSNFNGTSVPPGDYIWFNSNFSASHIPSSGATITFTNQTISFTANGTPYNLAVPNAVITFSPTATCSSTSFDTMTNTWMTTVPIRGDDEIFASGLAWSIPVGGLPGGVNPVNWQGTFSTSVPGINIQWKWGAAGYSMFTSNYNILNVKPGHQTACGINNGDHAGTPEGVNNSGQPWTQFVVGGARGGGGSNFTGSWSGTVTAPVCVPSGSAHIAPIIRQEYPLAM